MENVTTHIPQTNVPVSSDNTLYIVILSILLILLLASIIVIVYCYKFHVRRGGSYGNLPGVNNEPQEHKHTGWLIKRCEQDNQTMRDVENQIIKRNQLREITWAQDLDDGQTPVVVFCVNASRIGTDIESALRGVNNHRPVLVVLHCINKSSLRGDLSDDNYLLDQALRERVTGIAHFAFSDYEGFYSCRQNEDGFRKLRDFLTR